MGAPRMKITLMNGLRVMVLLKTGPWAMALPVR